ncbi:hypothetical protein [Pseudomonas aeruginosa]|uniref:hypothetical protein n=1 Tax=Pseudomonas aeruginosa TaxID=287 RepID=UPI002446A634|nr:hypothetical protein [Pseudomonas aeruginosa]MDH1421388.1 hypothetical protein [Pseudomonas aeruginosa]
MLVLDGTEDLVGDQDIFSLFEEAKTPDGHLLGVEGNEALLSGVEFQSNHAILEIFTRLATYLEITPRWASDLQKYVYAFITRRMGVVDHMEFFGSPYLGLQKITFTTADRNQWFNDIIDLDEEELKENLHNAAAIKKEWAVVGDAFNMTIPYLLYRIHHSKLPEKVKHQAMKDVVCMYHYKCLTSIIHNDYPFTARKEVVLETYNRLSLKYDIKRYGSWRALIEARAEFILNPKTGIHYDAFTQMNDDKKIVYMVGDIQNRLRRAINDINKVFHDVKNKTNIVKLENSKVNLGDELTIKSVAKDVNQHVQYLDRILTEETSFYKEELMNYAASVLEDVRMNMLTYTLQEFPKRYNNPKTPEYKQFAETVVLHLFDYLHANNIKRSKVYNVLIKMRGAYGASRSRNDMVKTIRELGDQIVIAITGRKTPQWVLTTRTALCLFIVLRVLSKDYFE